MKFIEKAVEHKYVILYVFLAALIFRLAFLATIRQDDIYFADAKDFHSIAVNVIDGNGYSIDGKEPSINRLPVYTLFITAIYAIAGKSFLAVRIIQLIISALTGVIIFLLAEKLHSRKAGVFSSVLFAVYPFSIYYSVHLLAETFNTFLIMLLFLLLSVYLEKKKIYLLIFAGILTGLCVLCKENIIPFLPFALVFYFVLDRVGFKQQIFRILILLFFAGLTVSPWFMRNYFLFQKFLYRADTPINILIGNNEYLGNVSFMEESRRIGDMIYYVEKLAPEKRAEYCYSKGFGFIRSHPFLTLRNFFIKAGRFWKPYPNATGLLGKLTGVSNTATIAISSVFESVIIFFGVLGIIATLGLWRKFLLLYLWIFSQTVSISLLYPVMRHRLQTMHLVMIFSAIGFIWIVSFFVSRKKQASPVNS